MEKPQPGTTTLVRKLDMEALCAVLAAASGLVNAPEFNTFLPQTAHGRMVEICAERLKNAVTNAEAVLNQ